MDFVTLIEFSSLGEDRGSLVAIEGNKDIPFDIKRIYYISKTKLDVSRGFHAHKKLKQVAICLSGQCRFKMDDGINTQEMVLKGANQGIVIQAMQWHEMHDFSEDCLLLVLASDYYDEDDYIRNYDNFLALVRKDK